MSRLIIFVLCAAAAFAQAAPTKLPTPLEQTLMSAEKDFIAAVKKGDPAFLQRTLADGFSFVAFDGQLYERGEMIDAFSHGGLDLLPYNMKVIPVCDDVAIVTYDVVVRVPPAEDEGPPPRYQHFSTTWVRQSDAKQGDAWKMKFLQMSVSHWGDW